MRRINLDGLRRIARALRSPPTDDEVAAALRDALDFEWPPPETCRMEERRRDALAKFDEALRAGLQHQAAEETSGRGQTMPAWWLAELDEMLDRMQSPEFARAAGKALDEPLRVSVPEPVRSKER